MMRGVAPIGVSRRGQAAQRCAMVALATFIALFVAMVVPAVAQAATTWHEVAGGPSGSRNLEAWYVCSSPTTGESECRELDMIHADEKSTEYGGTLTACNAACGGSVTNVTIYQNIIPPQINYLGYGITIDAMTIQCTIDMQEGTLSSQKQARFNINDSAPYVTHTASHSGVQQSNATIVYEAVLTYVTGGTNSWYNIYPGNGTPINFEFNATAVASPTISREAIVSWTCQIVDVDTGSIIWVPVVTPTPPGPTPTVSPFATYPFELLPVGPVTKTIDFDIGTPTEATCFTFVPGYHIDETVFGYELDLLWDPFELCAQEVSYALTFMDINLGAWLLVVVGVGGLGAAFKFFRTG